MQDHTPDNQPPRQPDEHRARHPHTAHGGHGGHAPSLTRLTTQATAHCLVGCAIGEWVGLAIGVTMGFNAWATIALATILGFIGGYTLGLWPLVRQGMSWARAFRTIWLGETISIAAMELAMNVADYHVGGVQTSSIVSHTFWLGYAAALPAGFVVAWPVNYWLLKRGIKQHEH